MLLWQNVLLQIGLNLLSLDGMAVHSVRQWVLKCDSCYEYVTRLLALPSHCSPANRTILQPARPPAPPPFPRRITTKVDKLFCPHCGNATLAKLGVTLRADGEPVYYYKHGRQANVRGTKYPLPAPRVSKRDSDVHLGTLQPAPACRLPRFQPPPITCCELWGLGSL